MNKLLGIGAIRSCLYFCRFAGCMRPAKLGGGNMVTMMLLGDSFKCLDCPRIFTNFEDAAYHTEEEHHRVIERLPKKVSA